MLKPMVQAAFLCCTITVNTADCAAPTKLIQVVSDNCAGYLLNAKACRFRGDITISVPISKKHLFLQLIGIRVSKFVFEYSIQYSHHCETNLDPGLIALAKFDGLAGPGQARPGRELL